ncbi:kelch-like protein 12 isoform X2 [Paramacrobiotus metropolitanus]|uniref:kelch-like protein 12 isoform X2 n=1 Tax=Paramacrobiotus metropolitanus TaxID=2943436 RepID=UPI00244644CB|nr:kelch-like protein 12 isoform X2 [Paramacrobiotus metropolitanus]
MHFDITQVNAFSAPAETDYAHFGNTINSLRAAGTLCDVVVKGMEVSARGIPCHRIILCAHSSYFRAMFTIGLKECHEETVQLRNISSKILQMAIDYIYSSPIIIDDANIQELLAAAVFLDIHSLANRCWECLAHRLDETNCLFVYCLPHAQTNRPYLMERAKGLVFRHFNDISHSQAFLELSLEKIIEIISSDDLCVEQENEVLHAVTRWLHHDLDNRRPQFHEVLQFVRQPFLTHTCLQSYNLLKKYANEDKILGKPTLDLDQMDESLPGTTEAHSSQNHSRKLYGSNTVVICAGGCARGENALNCVECLNPTNLSWSQWKPLPNEVYSPGLVNLDDGALLACGGYDPTLENPINNAYLYDTSLHNWKEIAGMQTARAYHGVAFLNGFVYAIGGNKKGSYWQHQLSSVERYDPYINQWETMASLPMPLSWLAAVAHKGRIYTFGGLTKSGSAVNGVFCYNPVSNSWSKVAAMPTARFGVSACVGPDGLLYVIGGHHGDFGEHEFGCVEAYDVGADRWFSKNSMNKERFNGRSVCVKDYIYALGGCIGSDYGDSVEVYDHVTDSWTVLKAQLPSGRNSFGCVTMRVRKPVRNRDPIFGIFKASYYAGTHHTRTPFVVVPTFSNILGTGNSSPMLYH